MKSPIGSSLSSDVAKKTWIPIHLTASDFKVLRSLFPTVILAILVGCGGTSMRGFRVDPQDPKDVRDVYDLSTKHAARVVLQSGIARGAKEIQLGPETTDWIPNLGSDYVKRKDGSIVRYSVPTTDLATIQAHRSSRLGTGAVVGLVSGIAIGFLVAVASDASCDNCRALESVGNAITYAVTPVYFGLGGFVIGGALGASIKTWEDFPVQQQTLSRSGSLEPNEQSD